MNQAPLRKQEEDALRDLEPHPGRMKKTLTVVGVGLAIVAVPVVLFALNIIVSVVQFVLSAVGVAFVVGLVGYLLFRRRNRSS